MRYCDYAYLLRILYIHDTDVVFASGWGLRGGVGTLEHSTGALCARRQVLDRAWAFYDTSIPSRLARYTRKYSTMPVLARALPRVAKPMPNGL